MTIFSVLSFIFRAIGLASWAENFLQKHEQKVAKDAADKVNRMSDAGVDNSLHKWERD